MKAQEHQLIISILKDAESKYLPEENVDLASLYYEEVEGMIEAEYRGCLRIQGLSMDRVLNSKFYDYILDFSQRGTLTYTKKEVEGMESIISESELEKSASQLDLKNIAQEQAKKTTNTLKVKLPHFGNNLGKRR